MYRMLRNIHPSAYQYLSLIHISKSLGCSRTDTKSCKRAWSGCHCNGINGIQIQLCHLHQLVQHKMCIRDRVYTLVGDLGVGKTVFTQGVAEGLGITEPVNSPTFTIIQEYESGRMPFYHFDVYRIGDIEEMEEIGYDDYVYGNGICLIEWANLIEEILPEQIIEITIEKNLEKGFDYRKITVTGLLEPV